MFIGLVARRRALGVETGAQVFWVNVPVGVFGTFWAYRKLKDNGVRGGGRIDWWGNLTFAIGLSSLLIGITNGIQPYRGRTMGWTNPSVIALADRRNRAARRVRRHRTPDRRAHVPARTVPNT